jgi:sulfur transfer complex TusBCD TusB component (DsrH family)
MSINLQQFKDQKIATLNKQIGHIDQLLSIQNGVHSACRKEILTAEIKRIKSLSPQEVFSEFSETQGLTFGYTQGPSNA